ncbi:hypothetical protein [Rhizobium leguminosarum]|uniref:hypothetical protein n=1 Tax=Rhizobium leguminosarum TaxID=384 RepID=UPI001C962825|nr:hypothetical protein [Rhizobium leguminosarum]MBY5403459.1 hypothetical protein [Rhizobium leguminosarum]
MPLTARQVWRDFVSDGIPASGNHKASKPDVRAWGTYLESFITGSSVVKSPVFLTKALLLADVAHDDNTMAWVIADPTTAYNGLYQKSGASGLGTWARVADLPFPFIPASNVGAGTASAIQATTDIPISETALIWLPIFATNTTTPVTVAFNGGSALTIKTNPGNDPVVGGLLGGMIVLGRQQGSEFRLISDQASSAIVAAAEAAADRAEDGPTSPSIIVACRLRLQLRKHRSASISAGSYARPARRRRHPWSRCSNTSAPVEDVAAANKVLDVVADRHKVFALACHLRRRRACSRVGITCGLQFWASGR